MNNFGDKVNFIWSVADLLRGPYKPAQYGRVILPLTVLRRLDCVLEPTKDAVLARAAELKSGKVTNVDQILNRVAKASFHNTSKLTFAKLKGDPNKIAANLTAYIKGFSSQVRDIFDKFNFEPEIARLEENDRLFLVISKFADMDLHPKVVSNIEMGYVFEELIRKFNEAANETAGDHFTPREVIRLMVNIVFEPDTKLLTQKGAVRTLFDPACGTGGMLAVADEYLNELNPDAKLEVFGQDFNPESYAVCGSDMLIKGHNIDHIVFGSSFTKDGFSDTRFDYMLANPPFGVEWRPDQKEIQKEHDDRGMDGRFGAGLPNGDPLKEKELPEKFATDEYQVLLVAEKYQTGFDQPLLHTMYVDKRLDGIQAVQTLSRLNRTCPGKEDTFVLDFVNKAEDIQAAFQPFYEQTVIGEDSDPRQLYELQTKMEAFHVFYRDDVDGFCKVFFKPKEIQSPSDHAMMNSHLDPAVGRFTQLPEEDQDEFRSLLNTFKNLYGFISQVIPFADSDLETLYSYAKFLATKLPYRSDSTKLNLDDEVTLKFYRLQKISEGSIKLSSGETVPVTGPTAVGTGKSKEQEVELSKLITILNERYGTEFTQADELFFLQLREEAMADEGLQEAAKANTIDNFRYVFVKALEGLFIDRMEQNEELFAKYMNDPDFKRLVSEHLVQQVYKEIRSNDAGANKEEQEA